MTEVTTTDTEFDAEAESQTEPNAAPTAERTPGDEHAHGNNSTPSLVAQQLVYIPHIVDLIAQYVVADGSRVISATHALCGLSRAPFAMLSTASFAAVSFWKLAPIAPTCFPETPTTLPPCTSAALSKRGESILGRGSDSPFRASHSGCATGRVR